MKRTGQEEENDLEKRLSEAESLQGCFIVLLLCVFFVICLVAMIEFRALREDIRKLNGKSSAVTQPEEK